MNLCFDAPQGIIVNSTNIFQFDHGISIGNHLVNIKKPVKDLRKSNEIPAINHLTFFSFSNAFLLSSKIIKSKQKFIKEVLLSFITKVM